MKKFTELIGVLSFVLILFLVNACQRNSTTSSTVTFQGVVHWGVKTSSNTVQDNGPVSNARVICQGHPEYALTDNNGNFSLAISANRNFSNNNCDDYWIKVYTESASIYYIAGNEYALVQGKPGDVIQVKTLLVAQYTHEEQGQ